MSSLSFLSKLKSEYQSRNPDLHAIGIANGRLFQKIHLQGFSLIRKNGFHDSSHVQPRNVRKKLDFFRDNNDCNGKQSNGYGWYD